jgi:hypothetical protein
MVTSFDHIKYYMELHVLWRILLSNHVLVYYTVMQASDAQRFQNLNQSLDFTYQAIANGIAQHAELRRVEIEKEKQKKLAAASTPVTAL